MLTQWPALKYSTHVFLIATRRNSPVIQQLVYRGKKTKRIYLYKGILHGKKKERKKRPMHVRTRMCLNCANERNQPQKATYYDFMSIDLWKRHNYSHRNVSVVARVREWKKESECKHAKGAFLNDGQFSTFLLW